jgi:hypothetical protein
MVPIKVLSSSQPKVWPKRPSPPGGQREARYASRASLYFDVSYDCWTSVQVGSCSPGQSLPGQFDVPLAAST